MRRIAVLRPEPGASATVERARRLGLDALAIPLFEAEPIAWQAPDPHDFDALLLTSANAIRHGGEQLAGLRTLRVQAVGEATAKAAREAGFHVETVGDSDVDALLGVIDPTLKLMHLCGEDRRQPRQPRQDIAPISVYRARALADVDIAPAEGAIVLVHSPRAARRFAELADAARLDRGSIVIAGISGAAADAAGDGWETVEAAGKPSDDALLALAASLCNNVAGT